MSASKVTLLFQSGTIDASGNAARSAGFSESYYSTLAVNAPQLLANWDVLARKRAALLPTNSRVVGGRFQTVDPVGSSRQYDNVYIGTAATANDLPGVALQWTMRSSTTANQKNVILRSIPDARVVTGEYSPSPAYDAALQTFFNELVANWVFRGIDRTQPLVRIKDIIGDGTVTTLSNHGLAVGDQVNIMSTRPDAAHTKTYVAIVTEVTGLTTFKHVPADQNQFVQSSTGGRLRKVVIIYPPQTITTGEVVTPVAITRKVGRPFRVFRGRRTVRH